MKTEYDPELIEKTVFLEVKHREAQGDSDLLKKYRGKMDPIYENPDINERAKDFVKAHLDLFAELGFDKIISGIIAEYPCVTGRISRIVVQRAVSRKEEGAEMFVHREKKTQQRTNTVMLRISPPRFIDRDLLEPFLRHELMHISDMVDDKFEYNPDFSMPGRTQAEENLVKDRYRILWDTTIDGRLTAAGKGPLTLKDQWEPIFRGLFQSNSSEEFEKIWGTASPTHALLMATALEIKSAPGASQAGNTPGAPCPLCSFPTYTWACTDTDIPSETAKEIQKDFPTWTPENGVCGHCFERYQLPRHALHM